MKKKLLLHTCCAPCSGFLADQFKDDFDLTIFFSNSNIYPAEEYDKRLAEAKNYFLGRGIKFVEDNYNHQDWLESMSGLEDEPEKGKRCLACYRYRLQKTAEFAKKSKFDIFTSTLSISPHKNAEAINIIGSQIGESLGIEFMSGDWKKNDGFKKASEFSHEQGFYRQNYCGCEFSVRK